MALFGEKELVETLLLIKCKNEASSVVQFYRLIRNIDANAKALIALIQHHLVNRLVQFIEFSVICF